MSLEAKLEAFRALVEEHRRAYIVRMGYNMEHQFDGVAKSVIILGKKYARVDVGSSGKFMVNMATEEIVGIKGYGVPHLGHRYGTLDTINEWDWSEYYPRKLAQLLSTANL